MQILLFCNVLYDPNISANFFVSYSFLVHKKNYVQSVLKVEFLLTAYALREYKPKQSHGSIRYTYLKHVECTSYWINMYFLAEKTMRICMPRVGAHIWTTISRYYLSKKVWPISYSNSLYRMCQDFLDSQ